MATHVNILKSLNLCPMCTPLSNSDFKKSMQNEKNQCIFHGVQHRIHSGAVGDGQTGTRAHYILEGSFSYNKEE